MLRLTRHLARALGDHARTEHPLEACGVIAGRQGSDLPERHVPLANIAASPVFYEVGSADLLALHRDLDARGEEVVVVYHSHTSTPAFPSATDRALAGEPQAHYVLLSTSMGPTAPVQLRSYRIESGEVREETVVIDG